MHKLLEKLDKELHKYADKEGELTNVEWQAVYSAIEARKDLLTSMAMEGEDQYGNYDDGEAASGRWPYYRNSGNGSYRRGRSMMMDPDLSYTDDYRRGSYRNGGRGGNSMRYSGHGGNDMAESLYMALDQATSEEERRSIKQLIDKIGC